VIDGSIERRDCSLTYFRDGRKLAVAVIHRDLEGLRAEAEFERRLEPSADDRARLPSEVA
jgi:hypothetical protein